MGLRIQNRRKIDPRLVVIIGIRIHNIYERNNYIIKFLEDKTKDIQLKTIVPYGAIRNEPQE